MIDQFTERRIKDSANVADVVGEFVQLKRHGRELSCACPFHQGTHLGHFLVSPKKNLYKCFVCGESGDSIDWLMHYAHLSFHDSLLWLAQRYGIPVDESEKKFTHVKRVQHVTYAQPKALDMEMLTLPLDLVVARRDTSGDMLCNWLRSLPWKDEQRNRLEKVLSAYAVGSTKQGMTIFWQIDEQGRVHTGKIMRYQENGRRYKGEGYKTDWIHSALERAGRRDLFDSTRQEMQTCLFGLHLLNSGTPHSNTVYLVESEKTALIMATAAGSSNGLWMATGGMQFLRQQTVEQLRSMGMDIVLFPDRDGKDKWRAAMQKLGYREGQDYQINNMFVNGEEDAEPGWWTEADGEKADPADIVVRRIEEAHERKSLARELAIMEACQRESEAFDTLAKAFELKPIKNK